MTTTTWRTPPMRHRQQGIVLFVSLALLLALSVGGVAAAQIATLELRMARNDRDAALAFHAAEAALLEAETWLAANADDPHALFAVDGNGLFSAIPYGEQPPWQLAGIWTSNRSRRVANVIPDVVEQPRYVIEWLSTFVEPGTSTLPPTTIDLFRITARGTGVHASATLQSTCGRARGSATGAAHAMTGRLSWVDLGT